MTGPLDKSRRKADASADGATPKRMPYVPPRLIEYGSASKLTASKPGTNNDSPNSQRKTGCL